MHVGSCRQCNLISAVYARLWLVGRLRMRKSLRMAYMYEKHFFGKYSTGWPLWVTGQGRKSDQIWNGQDWSEQVFLRKMTKSNWSTMFEPLCRRDDTCLERRYDSDVLRATSLVDRDVTTATRSTLELSRRPRCCYSETNSHGENSSLRQCSGFRTFPNVTSWT